jgi:hypothetical protein
MTWGNAMNEKRRAFYESFDAQLEEWGTQIAHLKARGIAVKTEFIIDYSDTLDALQLKRNEGWAKLKELKAAGDEAWEDLEKGMEKILTEGKTAFHEAVSRFK